MAIHDSDPERRNLVVTSLGFIIFYWGEGSLVSDELRLQLVNIKFENTSFLAVFAWVMLFWFAWRYWLTHQGDAKKEFTNELFHLVDQEFLNKYVAHKTGLVYQGNGGFGAVKRIPLEPDKYPPRLKYMELKKTEQGDDGVERNVSNDRQLNIPFAGMSLLKIDFKFSILAAIRKPGFTSYYVPYLLFYAAVLIGMWPFCFRYVG
jgi:hypothetical protein